ncbi:MAG: hypothetical protein HFE63_08895 [Clostridiales bacterium]|nr:hypothetical protein [Clostridiales bacterium]
MKLKSIVLLVIAGLITAFMLTGCGDKAWDASKLQLAEPLDPPADVTLTLDSFENGKSISVNLTNNSDEPFYFTEYFALQVKINDDWYVVPSDLAFIDIAYELQPGVTAPKEFDISSYGKLPSGNYRLAAWKIAVEFEVK